MTAYTQRGVDTGMLDLRSSARPTSAAQKLLAQANAEATTPRSRRLDAATADASADQERRAARVLRADARAVPRPARGRAGRSLDEAARARPRRALAAYRGARPKQ